ncbi:hypothetical protein AC249_AIPGENE16507 [Exaiptasia diaphana]|nr:hypothetical protein AC249_AIPGENE16507 [Exaiptasia diaphana]
MSCGCNCGKVRTKVLSKLTRSRSSAKHNDQNDVQKPAGTETAKSVNHQLDCKRSNEGLNENEVDLTTEIAIHKTEIKPNDQTDELMALKPSESKIDITDGQPHRRRSTVDVIRNFFVPKNRRDAICDEMEKEHLENSGVSLRQYRKFLATTSVLHELKML